RVELIDRRGEDVRIPDVTRQSRLGGDDAPKIERLEQHTRAAETLRPAIDIANPELTGGTPGEVDRERGRGKEAGAAARGVESLDEAGENLGDVDSAIRPNRRAVGTAAHEPLAREIPRRIEVN